MPGYWRTLTGSREGLIVGRAGARFSSKGSLKEKTGFGPARGQGSDPPPELPVVPSSADSRLSAVNLKPLICARKSTLAFVAQTPLACVGLVSFFGALCLW